MLKIFGLILSLSALISVEAQPQDGDGTEIQPEIWPGESLQKGSTRISDNFRFTLILLEDGFLAILDEANNGNSIWKVGEGRGHRLTLQRDGNLVLFDVNNNIVWQTNTNGSGIKAVLKNDGNLVLITSNGSVIWESGTVQKIGSLNPGENKDKMFPWQGFRQNSHFQLESENGKYILGFTGDGFFGIEDENGKSLWKVGAGRADFIQLSPDGNLILYQFSSTFLRDSDIIWQTNTKGSDVKFLQLRNDGNLVLNSKNDSVIWQSGTDKRKLSGRKSIPGNWKNTATAAKTTTTTTTTTTTPVQDLIKKIAGNIKTSSRWGFP